MSIKKEKKISNLYVFVIYGKLCFYYIIFKLRLIVSVTYISFQDFLNLFEKIKATCKNSSAAFLI